MKRHEPLRIGFIGIDTSHVVAFTELLNDAEHPYHVPGGNVCSAYGVKSADFQKSYGRMDGYIEALTQRFGVKLAASIEEVAEQSDVIMLESVDGRVHLEQFKRLSPFRKPVFVDKPFALTSADALFMKALAEEQGIPVMSCSALRFAEGLSQALANTPDGEIIGAECYGPMELEPTQPGMFWYGVHTADMLYRVLGKGCIRVRATTNADHDVITCEWADGRIGVIRGNRRGNSTFGGIIHRVGGSSFIDIASSDKPYYASLLEQVMIMFTTGKPPIDLNETVEIIRFMEAVGESRQTGALVTL
ncbi:Gfo/Idh/MocA family protein [Paenibacillus albus]|uniref:Gfo/Idh/MocA family oxidoreductase n=1 Tax=Paenibacillus albus TaxID=2495582 RepID=A0A3Q8X9H5_9BACL|nr:Gfo/Idh/MocA family oxidoreductase [Paenibacillus albus]AZN42383.1 gfo/Idh/MocA family oxidoreductase [Paenibacillus albus]